jgi:hypothetical protein
VLENTEFRKLDLFPSSGEGREISTLLGLLERDNLNHWKHNLLEIDQVSETLCFLVI